MSNSQAGGPPLLGCLRLLVHYICSCPAYLEDVPPSATCGYATVGYMDPLFMDTMHVLLDYLFSCLIITVHILLYCLHTTFPHSLRHI